MTLVVPRASPRTRRFAGIRASSAWAGPWDQSLTSERAAHGLLPQLEERSRVPDERRALVGVAPVQELGGRVERGPHRLVVRMPPEVAQPRGLPRHLLDVHALVEPELGVRSPDPGVLHTSPRTRTQPVRVHVVVDPD